MKKKKKSVDMHIWKDALNDFEVSHKNKYSLTQDTIHGRLRPEPEIIEHVLEELEDKIRHYFNLYKNEKEKRTNSESNNYYLQKEIYNVYETLDKNNIYTKKLEDKLENIKENQSSLIDTVRRIDLLYIQLDTLVQSFAGVCTQIASETAENNDNINKKKKTMKMLLDYIYPCRTLDPRINSLYGMLYYQSIGLLKDGKFISPPIPPIPPLVPSEDLNGWLPPSDHVPNHEVEYANNRDLFKSMNSAENKNSFSDLVKMYKQGNNNDSYEEFFSKYIKEEQDKLENRENVHTILRTSNGANNNLSNDKNNFIISQDLQSFEISISNLEIKYLNGNPKIICVVRYDSETAISAIQNTQRVTRPKDRMNMTSSNDYVTFNINSRVGLDKLPEKKAGDIPSFMIDIHDVSGKVLVGTARCSFISEKTLINNAPWDIYSRLNKSKPEIIGKVYVSVHPKPDNSILPAEMFKNLKKNNKGANIMHKLNAPRTTPILSNTHNSNMINTGTDTKIGNKTVNVFQKNAVLSKAIYEKDQEAIPSLEKVGPNNKTITLGKAGQSNNKTAALGKRGQKVTFKPYVSKSDKNVEPEEKKPAAEEAKGSDDKSKEATEGSDPKNTKNESNDPSNANNESSKTNSVMSRIRQLTMKFEASKNKAEEKQSTTPLKMPLSVKGKENGDKKALEKSKSVEKQTVEKQTAEKQPVEKQPVEKQPAEKQPIEKSKTVEKKQSPVMKDGVMKVKLVPLGKKQVPKSGKVDEVKDDKKEEETKEDKKEEETKEDKKEEETKEDKKEEEEKASAGVKKIPPVNKLKPPLKMKIGPNKDNLKKILASKLVNKEVKGKVGQTGQGEVSEKKEEAKAVEKVEATAEAKAEAKAVEKVEAKAVDKEAIKAKMLSILKAKQSKVPIPPKETPLSAKVGDTAPILKKPIMKPPPPPLNGSQSSNDDPDLKSILEKAKKKALFIDKKKVQVKLPKTVEMKKAIKKFVPKLANID
ncbi:conserved Plasmodium protein, unknown function [Plasmodium vinckei brucechwatti]|uniref:Uncharacterized protein n=1 Tax=Plasmodium vinckei brucechwatti TaxID=119398 RepID=A0A6V7SQT3_PLAVN|nr:conserved Plasmodium protein, unknown function [Plasmodium vinckei brucechwatti]